MKGWVYIITTKSMPNLVKVGFSTKDPELRALELNNTGNPHPYKVEYDVLVNEPRKIEQTAHDFLKSYHENKEWFNCSIEIAIEAIRAVTNGEILLENGQSKSLLKKDDIAKQSIGKFILQDGIATDTETGLVWLRFVYGQTWKNGTAVGKTKPIKWQAAIDFAENFNQQGGYGGYIDWRLPKPNELETLIYAKKKRKGGCFIDTDVFFIFNDQVDNTLTSFWTSSSRYIDPRNSPMSGNFAGVINFRIGSSLFSARQHHVNAVRLVRNDTL